MFKKIVAGIDIGAALYIGACLFGLVAHTAYASMILIFCVAYSAGSLLGGAIRDLRS